MSFSLNFPRSLRGRLLVLVALPTLVELLLVAKLTNLEARVEKSLESGQHYSQVLKALNELNVIFVQCDADFLNSKIEKQNQHGQLTTLARSLRGADSAIAQLGELIKGDPETVNLLNRIVQLKNEMGTVMRTFLIGMIDRSSTDAERKDGCQRLTMLAKQEASALAQLQTEVGELQFRRYAQSMKYKSEERYVLISLAVVNAFLCIVAIFALSNAASKRLHSLLSNMRRYAADETLIAPTPGSDEIAFIEDVFYKAAEELRSSHRKEQAFIDESHDPIVFVGEDLRILFANNSAQKNYDMNMGLRLSEKVPAIEATRAFLKNVQGGALRTTQIEVVSKDSRHQAILSAVWDPEARCYFCIIHDITERTKYEQMRSDLVSMFTHDLKSPLTALSLNLDLLSDGPLSDGQEQNLFKSFASIARMSNLVTDLLDLYKSEAGMMHFEIESFDMRLLVLSVKEEFATIAESLHVSIEINSNEESPIMAKGSAEASRRVLTNLLSNALKFSPEKGFVNIDIRTKEDLVAISIADAGPGIREENLPMLFERFHQFSEGANSRNSTFGSGLGLAICKIFAEQQGGSVSVKSKLGQGSIFTFVLPLDDVG